MTAWILAVPIYIFIVGIEAFEVVARHCVAERTEVDARCVEVRLRSASQGDTVGVKAIEFCKGCQSAGVKPNTKRVIP
jgi:hypothetical protein